jgi:RNA polymerase sigma factor (sigma-70 family)
LATPGPKRHFEGDVDARVSPLALLLHAVKRDLDERSDHRLLADFVDRHDDEAFEHLVQRHARHVWSVCYRMLGNSADAEDAFQATFVVLIRSGRMIADRGPLGGWLYGVAYRVALKARAMVARRRQKEKAAATQNSTLVATPIDHDLSELLNEELGRLSEPCRLAVVLCDIDGLTRKEAAAKLGWKETTLSGRLERGRKKLAARLRRRWFTAPAFTAPAVLAAAACGATLPPGVVAQTVSVARTAMTSGAATGSAALPAAVAELATGVLRDITMRIATKVLATAVLIVGILGGTWYGLGLSGTAPVAIAAQAPPDVPQTNRPIVPQPDKPNPGVVKDTIAVDKEPLADPVKTAIENGINYLKKKQHLKDGEWNWEGTELLNQAWSGGSSCLVTLALLTTGMKTDDPVIQKTLPYIRSVVPRKQIYVVALRTMVLEKVGDAKDKQIIRDDVNWLLKSRVCVNGELKGWTYGDEGTVEADNSNTQYAILGLLAGKQAGVKIESKDWEEIQKLFIRMQAKDGGWPYRPQSAEDKATHSMTCAGLCGLLISSMELDSDNQQFDPKTGIAKNCGAYEEMKAMDQGTNWLAKNFKFDTSGEIHRAAFYNIYGIARVGRLSGQRFIGEHDWYREGCELLCGVKKSDLNQADDGSWRMGAGIDNMPMLCTSFTLMFLAKGRTPILISKLAFDGVNNKQLDWSHKHHDAQNLVEHASKALFKNQPLAWQIFDPRQVNFQTEDSFKSELDYLLQSPILYMTGHAAPNLTDRQVELLRRYVDGGGFIFAEACCGSKDFDEGFRKLMTKAFDRDSQLLPLAAEHPIWTAHARLDPAEFNRGLDKDRVIQSVERKSRIVVVFSPQPLAGYWEDRRFMPDDAAPKKGPLSRGELAYRFAENVIAYATGLKMPKPRQ